MNRPLQHHRKALVMLLCAWALSIGTVHADDLDIYTDPTPLPTQAPLTALALDLNLTNPNALVCQNVLTSSEQNCVDIRSRISLADLVTLLGVPATVIGPLNPATLLADLSDAARAALTTPLSVGATLSLTQLQVYVLGIQQIVTALADSRLTIILNHNNRGPLGAACPFADLSNLGGTRQLTPGCSNGAYLFVGLTNLADPIQLAALVTRLVRALVGDPVTINSGTSGSPVTVTPPTVPRAFIANHPYQAKEIYAELAKYLRGDAIFNGHLGVFDYGDEDATNNLNNSFPPLSWDTNAEQPGNLSYKSGLAAYPQACNINLVHLQATNAAGQDDSDTDLKALFPEGDIDGNGGLTLPEVVAAADSSGFVFGSDDRRRINSRFVVQENLFANGDLSDLDRINSVGGNVSTYTNFIGLLGRGQSIAGSLIKPLSVDTALTSLTIAASRSSVNGRTDAAYLPVFRADPQQRPAWPGNLKRLKLRIRSGANAGKLFDVVDARDTGSGDPSLALTADGRIRSTALTVWTKPALLGGKTVDGPVADLGGAGQNIPGYAINGGGNPGRSNAVVGGRKLYYDSVSAVGSSLCADLASCGNLNPDDSAVRAELQAATGATPFVVPTSTCAVSCGIAATTCGALCTTTQTTCNTSCNLSATTCNALCLAGPLGNSCRASCTATQSTCLGTCGTTAAGCNTACGNTQNMCVSSCSASASSRDTDTITRELLLYARGYEVGTKSAPAGSTPNSASPTNSGIGSRKWMLGAVLHSRPVAINYGRRGGAASDDVRVVFGSADGVMHMISDSSGAENWGFMPQAVMGSLAALRENQAGTPLPYGVDGAPIVLIRDKAPSTGASAGVTGIIGDVVSDETANPPIEGDRVLLFFGLRRGGAAYYAMDITNPDAPRLLWRLSPAGLHRAGQATVDAGSAADFSRLGLSFSTPQVARIRLDASGVNEAANNDVKPRTTLVFGGGYNGGRNGAGIKIGKDFNNSRNSVGALKIGLDDGSATTADRGNALFMVDAATGQLVWRAIRSSTASATPATAVGRSYGHPLLADGVASDVTVIDTDNDGFSDRLYVGDTGGRMWRADFASALVSDWTMTPIASIGRHNGSGIANDRRIFFAPDFVPIRNTLDNQGRIVDRQGTDIVLFGTGDREDPLNLETQNSFYAIRDTDLVSGKAAGEIVVSETDTRLAKHGTCGTIAQCFNDVSNASGALTDITSMPVGYRFQYPRTGEKHFSAPVTLGSTVTFTSFVPPDPSVPGARICTPSEGVSRLFSIGLRTSAFRSINSLTSAGRDTSLATGLPGEVNALAGTQQAAGGQVYAIPANDKYRASWRERLGETQK